MKLAIIGCCASRDWVLSQRRGAARIVPLRPHFHSSALAVQFLPALASVPPVDPLLARLDTAVVTRDLTRSWTAEMLQWRPDVVLVDLCYEASGSLVFWHGGWVTRSVSLRLSAEMSGDLPDPIGPRSAPDLFEAIVTPAFAAFGAFMAEHLPQTRILLHRVRYADAYRDRFGRITPFEPDRQKKNLAMNMAMDSVERLFLAQVPNCEVLDPPVARPLGDVRHRWGLHPVHFDETYYRSFLTAFRKACGLPAGRYAMLDRVADGLSEVRRRWRIGIPPLSDA